MEKVKNIHPGEVLLKDFLLPLGITAYRLSKESSIPQTRISEISKGKKENYRRYSSSAFKIFWQFG